MVKKDALRGRCTPEKCAKCSEAPTEKGHDYCLGTLPFVWNACCGHGNTKMAYIQWYKNRFFRFSGRLAIITQKILRKELFR